MTNYNVAPLFEPLQVKNKRLRNRIVVPPMVVNHGLTGQDAWDWYGKRAAGGAALVIVEAADSPRFGTELTAETLRPLADAIHRGGALAGLQIFPGRRGQKINPADLSAEDIELLLEQFRVAAEACAGAGFDAVEPHGAHNYLLNRFFSPQENTRTGEYGGDSLEGRMRLALDIVKAISPIAQSAGMLLLYRHSPIRFEYGIEDSVAFAKELLRAGVDVLDISPASDVSPADRAAPFVPLGAPVIAVNLLDQLDRALLVLNEKRAHLVAIGRAHIADPEWANKVQAGRFDDIVACIRCDQCRADLAAQIQVGCPEWGRQRR